MFGEVSSIAAFKGTAKSQPNLNSQPANFHCIIHHYHLLTMLSKESPRASLGRTGGPIRVHIRAVHLPLPIESAVHTHTKFSGKKETPCPHHAAWMSAPRTTAQPAVPRPQTGTGPTPSAPLPATGTSRTPPSAVASQRWQRWVTRGSRRGLSWWCSRSHRRRALPRRTNPSPPSLSSCREVGLLAASLVMIFLIEDFLFLSDKLSSIPKIENWGWKCSCNCCCVERPANARLAFGAQSTHRCRSWMKSGCLGCL